MAMGEYEKSKFRFSETFSNSDGKTSGSAFVGVLLGLLAGIGFIAGTIGWYLKFDQVMDYLDQVLQLGFLAAALMGVRKVASLISANKGKKVEDEENKKKEDREPIV
jgi:uncharacterized membrane protein required for colicin V production